MTCRMPMPSRAFRVREWSRSTLRPECGVALGARERDKREKALAPKKASVQNSGLD